MSPTSSAEPAIAPKALSATCAGGTGTTWAMGTPRLVTSSGRPVLRTRSKAARQVALNVEIGRESTSRSYHGP